MPLQRFTTTALSDLRAAGRVGEMQHAVIAPFLARELGPRHGRLFAEVEAEGSDLRGWYAEAAAEPRRVAALPPAEREAVTREAAALIGDVARLAERMAGESPQRANLGRILQAATAYPPEDLWCDGDQPIVVNWGFTRAPASARAPRAIAEVAAARMPVPPPPGPTAAPDAAGPGVVPPPRRRFPAARLAAWPLWLLFAVLLAAVYRLLLPACAIGPAGWSLAGSCAAQAAAPSAELAWEGETLRALVRQAEVEVAAERQICAAPRPRRAAAAVPAAPAAAAVPLAPVTAATPPAGVDAQVESRLPAAAPRGGVEVSLLWDDRSDLDLMIDCPGGATLSQSSPGLQACGGHLLQDVNKPGSTLLDHPIEHAAWNDPPPGLYTVKVGLWGYNGVAQGSEIPFTVRIRRGAEERVVQGRIKGTHTMVTVATANF